MAIPKSDVTVSASGYRALKLSFSPKKFARAVLTHVKIAAGTVEFNFVDGNRIQQVNRDFLGHDYVTDIVTFNLAPIGQPVMGDIYICPAVARENADAFGVTFENEIRRLIAHGILHLMGYLDYTDDERAHMESVQEGILVALSDH